MSTILFSNNPVSTMSEENCVGAPFWYLATSAGDGTPTDEFHVFPEAFAVRLPLFISRQHAEAYRSQLKDSVGYRVFGMPQYRLRNFLAAALPRNMPVGLVFEAPDEDGNIRIFATDAEAINRDFLVEPIRQMNAPSPLGAHTTPVRRLVA